MTNNNVIIQTAISDPIDVIDLANRIHEVFSEPCSIGGHQLTTTPSVGIALAPDDSIDPDQLLKNADLAMYAAKSEGRGTYHFFEPAMDASLKARRALELDLRKAIERNEFELYYQPLVTLRDSKVTGCEALVRWRHPERGMICPADFIPLAEETGPITTLGEWVLKTACAAAATWPDDIKVAVNVSPVQFRSAGLAQLIVNVLASSGLPAARLELEVTEAVLIHDHVATLAVLHRLRGLGVSIALDDFGTGYSSLSYLQRFPFDKIKIDRSFNQGRGRIGCIKGHRAGCSYHSDCRRNAHDGRRCGDGRAGPTPTHPWLYRNAGLSFQPTGPGRENKCSAIGLESEAGGHSTLN